jgi:sugar/nucleoside kinase (ribokinase family)
LKKETNVLVVGELNVDLILDRLEKFPELGKEVIANRMLLTLGSSSAIFASNLAVLGTRVSFCGRVGQDNFGDKIISDLASKGVQVNHIIRSRSADTGITVALNVSEDRAMVTYPGAMNEFCEDDITDDMLDAASHLHVSSVFLQPALRPGLVKLFRRAKQKGLSTSMDPQWDPAEQWAFGTTELLPEINIFLPNLEELKNITRRSSLEEGLSCIKEISDIVVVKNGNSGATLQKGNNVLQQQALLNKEVADAIGAGDSFNAGFIHRYVQGSPLEECLRFGALCGAVNTTRSGGTTAFADYDTFRQLALQHFNIQL